MIVRSGVQFRWENPGYRDFGDYLAAFNHLTPFPGTPLYERFARAGRLIEPFAWEKRTLFDVTFQPAQMSVNALRKGLLDLASKVYSREFTDFRRRQFLRRKLAADNKAA